MVQGQHGSAVVALGRFVDGDAGVAAASSAVARMIVRRVNIMLAKVGFVKMRSGAALDGFYTGGKRRNDPCKDDTSSRRWRV